MLKIKLLSCLLIVFMLSCFAFGFTSSSIDFDGIMSETDWRNIEPEVIVSLSGESNCDVYFATVCVLTEESSNRLIFGFKVKVPGFAEDSANHGVAVRINNDEFVYITPDTVSEYDYDKYHFESVVNATSQTDFTAEIAVGVKYGLFTVDNIEVRVMDSDGEPSNVYTLNVGEIITQPQTVVQEPQFEAVEVIVPAESPTTQKQTTTKKTTTKATTTKKPTTQKETTTKKTTVADEELDLQPTTKKQKDTTNKSTIKTEDTTSNYIVEESTDIVETNQTTSFPYWYETTRRISDSEETTVLTVNQLKLQKGLSYAAVAALILLALGICVVINLKHDKEHK